MSGLLPDDPDRATVQQGVASALGLAGAPVQQEETFWALRKLLEALAWPKPLVLVIDDLQWAEGSLVDLIKHIATRSVGQPMVLLCLARPELREVHPILFANDDAAQLPASSFTLEPLETHQTEHLILELDWGSQSSSAATAADR